MDIDVRQVVGGRSSWKLQEVPIYRRWLARLHGWLQKVLPFVFGPHEIRAFKSGHLLASTGDAGDWKDLLCSPGGGVGLTYDESSGRWVVDGEGSPFPDLDGIPVIIEEDRVKLKD